jgi:hypothetical protein
MRYGWPGLLLWTYADALSSLHSGGAKPFEYENFELIKPRGKWLIESDMQHNLWRMTLDNKLSLAPLKREPQHVLDLGTGTGIWAIDYGNYTYNFFPIL